MAQENVELARRLYPGAVDYVTMLSTPEGLEALQAVSEAVMHPDYETVTVPGQVPLSGASAADPAQPTVHGLDGFVSAFRDWLSAWASWVVTATDFIDARDDRVLVLLDVRARSKTHGVEMPIEAASLLTIRDGMVTRIELFFDRAQAREAAGPTE
jgi:ketosteroid isomerase-like protein